MRLTRFLVVTAALALCALGISLLLLNWRHPQPAHRSFKPARTRPRSPASPSQAALQEAKQLWGQAQMAIKPEMEALAAADPYSTDPEGVRRQQLMAQDRGGFLRRAHEAARRAIARAKSPQETYEATFWMALIECDRGQHRAELQHVRHLVALRPRSPMSWGAVRRAAKCNGLWQLARQADRTARELTEEMPDGQEDRP